MKKTNILILGSGGREHSTAWRIMKSPQVGNVYVAPGNPGTAMLGCKNIPLLPAAGNFPLLCELAEQLFIDLVIVGPEAALAQGAADAFRNRGIAVFGPGGASVIESSKSYAKELMRSIGIPTADFAVFGAHEAKKAKQYARSKNGNVVVKADGLALGKGAIVCVNDITRAETAIDDMLVKGLLGRAGNKIVIEDLLEGPELSIHALSDGYAVRIFPALRDHKHLLEGNKGPMTGGMGVCGPIDVDPELLGVIEEKIVLPCIQELAKRHLPFVGCLYPGLMLTKDGPKVLEFNARFGDPEAQVYMRLLDDSVDLIEVLMACATGRLNEVELVWRDEKCVCIVLAAHGYPENPRKGDVITIGDAVDPVVFHAGTKWKDGLLCTDGGRVLNVTQLTSAAPSIAYLDTYAAIHRGRIHFYGMQFRNDIAASLK